MYATMGFIMLKRRIIFPKGKYSPIWGEGPAAKFWGNNPSPGMCSPPLGKPNPMEKRGLFLGKSPKNFV